MTSIFYQDAYRSLKEVCDERTAVLIELYKRHEPVKISRGGTMFCASCEMISPCPEITLILTVLDEEEIYE